MDSSSKAETEEEKAFQKGVGIGFVVGAISTGVLLTVFFLYIGLYY